MKHRLVLDFEGLANRSEFRGRYTTEIKKWCESLGIKRWNGVWQLLNEILKNVHDHARGLGRLEVECTSEGVLTFLIRDYILKAYDLDKIKEAGSTKFGNRINFGAGICGNMIRDLADSLECQLTIDASAGFTYVGTMPVEIGATTLANE